MIEDLELRRLFKAESEEHLAHLDDGLLRLEKTPADHALLEEVFRESHSLKGAARMLGLSRIETAAHGLEGLLNAARAGEKPLSPEAIEKMSGVLGKLRGLVREALAVPESAPPSATPAAPAGMDPVAVGQEAAPAPSAPAAPREAPAVPLEPEAPAPLPLQPPSPPAEVAPPMEPFHIDTVRVETDRLDDILTQVGELSVIQGRGQRRLAMMEELLERWTTRQGVRLDAAGGDEDEGKYFGKLLKEARDVLYEEGARLESTVKLLEDQVNTLRRLPLSTIFTMFPRTVHDLGKGRGKEAELVLEGGEVTVDKRILEEIKDPLMHLIRNAVDHGIETPEERERAGKPRVGTVRLSAAREGGSVVIGVSDDGRGLDLEAIRRTAARHGIHDDETLASLAPEQIQQLIFQSGFTTTDAVTELSGRGVGLDVVRVNVGRLKGRIRVDSVAGRGTTVRTTLPLSLATTRLLLARVAGRLYGLPMDCIQSTRRLHEGDLFHLEGRPAVLFDGRPVITARLDELLELPLESAPGHATATPDSLACVVLAVGEEWLGLLVDELWAEEEVSPKPLGAPLQRVRNVSALAVLGSGEICAVLNPADLLRSAQRRRGAAIAATEGAQAAAGPRRAILLVEDSALVRAMEKRILEDAGYEVVTAVDGLDALNQLGGRTFAAVVSDIVMPNLDGLDLTARIRAEPRYRELPVVLVTTLSSDDDKRRGLEVGANAYLPKPTFDQRLLLSALERLIAT